MNLRDRVEILAEIVRAAFAHRLRASLTILGIVIGTGSIVLLAALLRGGEAYLVHANQEASDDDVIEVHKEEPPPAQRDHTTRPLSRGDATALGGASVIRGALVEPESSLDTLARFQGRRKRVAIVSTGASTRSLYRLTLAKGRELDESDRRLGSRVCVVGHEIYEELLRSAPLDATPLHDGSGLRIEVDGRLFSVVGVLAKKPMLGQTDSTYLWDRKVMIPETTYDAIYAPSHEVQRIYVRGASDRTTARAAVAGVILRRHFGVMNFALAKDESGGMEQLILGVIQVLLLGTGVLALLASGINIMNVMLVTVSERRREIGLRRALGATQRSILVQFLFEAGALSLIGALVGVVAGITLAWGVTALARSVIGYWVFAIPTWSVALGVGLAVTMGLVFGSVPAWRASRVSPIDALRSE